MKKLFLLYLVLCALLVIIALFREPVPPASQADWYEGEAAGDYWDGQMQDRE